MNNSKPGSPSFLMSFESALMYKAASISRQESSSFAVFNFLIASCLTSYKIFSFRFPPSLLDDHIYRNIFHIVRIKSVITQAGYDR